MIELKHEQFEAQKELAKVHGEISTAKATLLDIKDNVDKYLAIRKVKEQEMLNVLYSESKELVDSIQKSFSEVSAYYKEVRSYTVFLKEMQVDVKNVLDTYRENADEFVVWAKKEESRLANIRKELQEYKASLDTEKKQIAEDRKEIEKEKRHIESRNATLEASHKELKKLWNKVK